LPAIALAVGTTPDPNLDENEISQEEKVEATVPELELLDIGNPNKDQHQNAVKNVKKTETFYPYQSTISPRIGSFIDYGTDSAVNLYLFGFSYMFDSTSNKHWELSIDAFSNTKGMIYFAHRWILNSTSGFRPFYKLGASTLIKPEEQLGAFFAVSNYQARIGIGTEQAFFLPMSWRLDLEAAYGSKGAMAAVIIGYSWGF